MARRRRNPVLTWIVTSSCIAFGAITARLPLPVCRFIGRWLGRVAYYLVPRIRRVALENLELVYGDTLDRREKVRIARASAENVGIVAAEFSHIPELKRGLLEKEVDAGGFDQFDADKGVLLIGAHLGNWEWMGPVTCLLRGKTVGIVRPLDDPRLDNVIETIRGSTGADLVSKEGAGAEVIKRVRDGWVVGLLIDQNPRKNALPIHFLGQDTWGTIGPAMIAARASHVPVCVACMVREKSGRYTFDLSSPLDIVHTGNLRDDLMVNTRVCHEAIEAEVRKHPEQWLWFHRRFKPRPKLQEEFDARMAKKTGGNEQD